MLRGDWNSDLIIEMENKVQKAKELAEENYSEWGQWVVECMTDEEVQEDIGNSTIEEWVEIRKKIARICEEREKAW